MTGLEYWSQHCRLLSRLQDAKPLCCVWKRLIVVIELRRREGIAWVLTLEWGYGWHGVLVTERGALGTVQVVWSGLLEGMPTGQGKE